MAAAKHTADIIATVYAKEAEHDEPIFKPYARAGVEEVSRADRIPIHGSVLANFAARASDIAGGCSAIQQLLQSEHVNDIDRLHHGGTERPLLSEVVRERLAHLSIAALDMLGTEATSLLEWAHDFHTPEGALMQRLKAGVEELPPFAPPPVTKRRADRM